MLHKNNQEKGKFTVLLIFILYSTKNWKNMIDKISIFFDGGKMPCILVENKADLLDKNEIDKTQELEEFAEYNGYDGYFRTSTKTGLNINEAVQYLIDNILKRIKYLLLKKNKVKFIQSKNISLEKNEVDNKNNQKNEESSNIKKYCNKEHVNAITSYCSKCQIYLCDKCVDNHKEKFEGHHIDKKNEIPNKNIPKLNKDEN